MMNHNKRLFYQKPKTTQGAHPSILHSNIQSYRNYVFRSAPAPSTHICAHGLYHPSDGDILHHFIGISRCRQPLSLTINAIHADKRIRLLSFISTSTPSPKHDKRASEINAFVGGIPKIRTDPCHGVTDISIAHRPRL